MLKLKENGASICSRNKFIIRWLDCVMSILILAVLFLILIPLAVIKLIFDGRPLFYNSKRIGVDGELFTVFKFRTMINDRATIINYIKNQNRSGFEAIPLDAPIYTAMGRIFEKYQLVEMPQFFNVLLGKMSLVGYRPLPKSLVDELVTEFGPELISKRHNRVPGITGLAQLKDKNKLSNYDRVHFESTLNFFLLNEQSIFKLIVVYFFIIIDTFFFILLKKPVLLHIIFPFVVKYDII